jgi:hypothetical protein
MKRTGISVNKTIWLRKQSSNYARHSWQSNRKTHNFRFITSFYSEWQVELERSRVEQRETKEKLEQAIASTAGDAQRALQIKDETIQQLSKNSRDLNTEILNLKTELYIPVPTRR